MHTPEHRLQGKKIILGISGSIAAYKSVVLLRLLQKAGAEVKVVMTDAATRFVGEATLRSLSRHPVMLDLWGESDTWTQHVHLGKWADMMVVAPASANTLAKLAHGLCDNALTAVYLSADCPVLLAPAMDLDMYRHPATQRNLQQLAADGVAVMAADSGYLASGLAGAGRLPAPEQILDAISRHMAAEPGVLAGQSVLITAGPTREAIDPVRFFTNHSTGKMGIALAAAAQQAGAEVTLVLGPTTETPPAGVEVVDVARAEEMAQAVEKRLARADVFIAAAAVADYRPATTADDKLKKQGETLTLELVRTPDILANAGQRKRTGQVLVGFALESVAQDAAIENARGKLQRKNLDMIVMNTLSDTGAGFAHDTNQVTLLMKDGQQQALALANKTEIAGEIIQAVAHLLEP